jgi:hypothetical protein
MFSNADSSARGEKFYQGKCCKNSPEQSSISASPVLTILNFTSNGWDVLIVGETSLR